MTAWKIVTGVLVLALSAGGGLWFVPAVLRAAGRRSARDDVVQAAEPSGATDAPGVPGPDSEAARGALRGGTWIGLLERVAVTGCLLAGFTAGVAVVVAVKGLGRYPELKENPGASERFVVGTLASLVWAGLAGWLGTWVVGLIG